MNCFRSIYKCPDVFGQTSWRFDLTAPIFSVQIPITDGFCQVMWLDG